MLKILKENQVPILNLFIGCGAALVSFRAGITNLPLSIAVCFLVAAFLNMAGLGTRKR